MEDKEIRLFSQLEELKSLHSTEIEAKEIRVKDLENMMTVKNQLISELEREVK